MVWSRWSGARRGEGHETILYRVELLPTPRVQNLNAINMRSWSAGKLPEGSIRIDQISCGSYTEDQLRGLAVPAQLVRESGHEDTTKPLNSSGKQHSIPVELQGEDLVDDPKIDFFWEVVEDRRGDEKPKRQRFRLMGLPNRKPGMFHWSVVLERASKDTGRNARTQEHDDDVVKIP